MTNGASDTVAADTIAAIATATAQRTGIGIVRISGPQTREIAKSLLGAVPGARQAALRDFRNQDGMILDRGLALYFAMPASYTGEDVLELHAHGGVALLRALLDCVIAAGARRARPGEFTERAFLNGRIDLLQAEAVADLIDAGSEQSARAAHATLRGEFSRRVNALTAELINLRSGLEAGLDFSEEDLGEQHLHGLARGLSTFAGNVDKVLEQATRGVRLTDGFRVVLIGAPNVGKSSVMNRLAGDERAIVTSIPGTTRDVIRDSIQLDGMAIELMDTAGLHDSDDVVEQIGMLRTMDQARSADLVLLVCDDRDAFVTIPVATALPTDADVLVVYNKIDLSGASSGLRSGSDEVGVGVSATTGNGFDVLIAELTRRSSVSEISGEFSARQRHLDCLRAVRDHLEHAQFAIAQTHESELVAEDLRQCQIELGRITGVVTSDDLLGEIFSSFCIGK